MSHVLASESAVVERKRLLDQAKHCRDLADRLDDVESVQALVTLARSYEAKAKLIVSEN
jgi:hypothetical protein